MSLVTEQQPLPVSTIEIVVGVMWYVKSACVVGFCVGLKSRLIAWNGDMRQFTRLSDRLKPFSTDELAEIIYRMDLAGIIVPLPPKPRS